MDTDTFYCLVVAPILFISIIVGFMLRDNFLDGD